MTLRPYHPDDAPALPALFRDSVRRVNARDYSPEQIAVWASDDIDLGRWAGRFDGRFAVVAEESGRPVGFAELEPDGHIDRVYVSADYQRRGAGRELLGAILAEARRVGIARLFVEAGITARPFFEAQGFSILERQVASCRGTELVNYLMARSVVQPHAAADTDYVAYCASGLALNRPDPLRICPTRGSSFVE